MEESHIMINDGAQWGRSSCSMEQHIDSAPSVHASLDGGLAVFRRGDVASHEEGVGAESFDDRTFFEVCYEDFCSYKQSMQQSVVVLGL